MAFIENEFNKPEVNHIDGNKLNNHYTNLEWCTTKENLEHKRLFNLGKTLKAKLAARGHKNSQAKLSEKQVIEILSTENIREINLSQSVKYGVSIATIYDIKTKRSWSHIV